MQTSVIFCLLLCFICSQNVRCLLLRIVMQVLTLWIQQCFYFLVRFAVYISCMVIFIYKFCVLCYLMVNFFGTVSFLYKYLDTTNTGLPTVSC
jgi:hypothetical protein